MDAQADRLANMALITAHLRNDGSVARDHLANERTFLAWLRTSLTFASAGVALTQLFRISGNSSQTSFDRTTSSIIGSLFVAGAIALTGLGTWRYFHVQFVLQKQIFPAARGPILFAFALTFALIVAALGVLIRMQTTQ